VEDEKESIRIMRAAIDRGLLIFMDNSWDYNDGESEIRMGKALRDGLPAESLSDDKSGRAY
jgi:aryl-alcohol dehydrogenase-like predicted oxidoreductase